MNDRLLHVIIAEAEQADAAGSWSSRQLLDLLGLLSDDSLHHVCSMGGYEPLKGWPSISYASAFWAAHHLAIREGQETDWIGYSFTRIMRQHRGRCPVEGCAYWDGHTEHSPVGEGPSHGAASGNWSRQALVALEATSRKADEAQTRLRDGAWEAHHIGLPTAAIAKAAIRDESEVQGWIDIRQ